MVDMALMTAQGILPSEVTTANRANECLPTATASHTLIGMSMSIVGTTKGRAATLGAHNTTAHGGLARRFFVYGRGNGLRTRTAPDGEVLLLGGNSLVLDRKLLLR